MFVLKLGFIVFFLASIAGALSTHNKSVLRDSRLKEHLQLSTLASIPSSAPQNGKDVATEKHTFFALILPTMHSRSYSGFRAPKNRFRESSRSTLSTPLRNVRRRPTPEQTQQVSTGKLERKAGAMDKLAIDHDLNEHTASYLEKLFRPHTVQPHPLHHHSPPLFPGPGSRRRYQTQRDIVKLFQRKHNLSSANRLSVHKASTREQQSITAVLDQTRHLPSAPAASSRAKRTLNQVEHLALHLEESEANSTGQKVNNTQRSKRSSLDPILVHESADNHRTGTRDYMNLTKPPFTPDDDAASLLVLFARLLQARKDSFPQNNSEGELGALLLGESSRAGAGKQYVGTGEGPNLDIMPADSNCSDANSPNRTHVLDSGVSTEKLLRYYLNRLEKKLDNNSAPTLNYQILLAQQRRHASRTLRRRSSAAALVTSLLRHLAVSFDLKCLALFLAGHKYFGFDPRRGNEITWRYRKKVSGRNPHSRRYPVLPLVSNTFIDI